MMQKSCSHRGTKNIDKVLETFVSECGSKLWFRTMLRMYLLIIYKFRTNVVSDGIKCTDRWQRNPKKLNKKNIK